MALILEAWRHFTPPDVVTKETPLTALFRNTVLSIYDPNRISFIALEDPISDPNYGTELGRNDLNFYPIAHKRQTIFFTVECKRLHTSYNTLIGEYLNEGAMRFITNRYSQNLPCGAMLGYVMDGKTDKAFKSLCGQIKKQKAALQLTPENAFTSPSHTASDYKFSADTQHLREGKNFILHHILFPIKRPAS